MSAFPGLPQIETGIPSSTESPSTIGGGFDALTNPAPKPFLDESLFAAPQTESVWGALADKPHLADLFDKVATRTKQTALIEDLGNSALQGIGVDAYERRRQEDDLRKRAADFIQRTADLPDGEYRAAVDRLRGAGANTPQLEQPGLRSPGWANIALSVLGAAFDPNHGTQALAAPWLAASGVRDQDLALARQRYQAALQTQDQAISSAKADVGFAQDDMERERRGLLTQAGIATSQADEIENDAVREQNRAYQQEGLRLQREDRQNARQDREDAGRERNANVVADRYSKARTLPEMQTYAKRYNSLVSSDLQIDDAAVQRDYDQRQRAYVDDARNQFGKSLDRSLNAFGEIDPESVKDVEEERKHLAEAYGVPESAMQAIPSGKNLRAQEIERKTHEFEQKLGFQKSQWKERFGEIQAGRLQNYQIKLADHALASRRLAAMSANQNVQQQIAMGNLGVRQQMASLARDKANKANDAKGEGMKAIDAIDAKIRVLNGQMSQANLDKNKKKASGINVQIAGLRAQREFLSGQLPEEVQNAEVIQGLGAPSGNPAPATGGTDLSGYKPPSDAPKIQVMPGGMPPLQLPTGAAPVGSIGSGRANGPARPIPTTNVVPIGRKIKMGNGITVTRIK